MEDELPDYDLDSEDEAFLEIVNKNRTKVELNVDFCFRLKHALANYHRGFNVMIDDLK